MMNLKCKETLEPEFLSFRSFSTIQSEFQMEDFDDESMTDFHYDIEMSEGDYHIYTHARDQISKLDSSSTWNSLGVSLSLIEGKVLPVSAVNWHKLPFASILDEMSMKFYMNTYEKRQELGRYCQAPLIDAQYSLNEIEGECYINKVCKSQSEQFIQVLTGHLKSPYHYFTDFIKIQNICLHNIKDGFISEDRTLCYRSIRLLYQCLK